MTGIQARQFMLIKHGLNNDYKFTGKQGILDFILQAGCIQFDPVDVCGKNAELVLQSRVKDFDKDMLYQLLYTDRTLIDYFDKNLSIMPVGDWKYFERNRIRHRLSERSMSETNEVRDEIIALIRERGAVCSADLDMNRKISWYWSSTNLSRAALEHMYFTGELAIAYKKGTIKYYDLVENCIPADILAEADPYPNDYEHMKWRVLRRIGALGLMWNRASDAWLGIEGLKSEERSRIFSDLISEGKISEAEIDGLKDRLYFLAEDTALLNYILHNPELKKRCELIAPLDNMLWDRKLINALFGFDYKWEIYTPEAERKYGHYVLPILYGNSFIGRIEFICDKKAGKLAVKNLWYEAKAEITKETESALNNCIERFAAFNNCVFLK